MAYGIHDLKLTGLQVKTILSVHIRHKAGEHGVMELTADMGERNMDIPIQETGSEQKVTLIAVKNGNKILLFSGIITNLTSQSMGKSCHVNLTARSWSYRMDIKKKSRSFQNTSMTYGSLVSKIVGEYTDSESQILFADVPLGEIAVQYQETDWQFLKRMLSSLHVPLVCSEVREKLCVYAGVAQIPAQMDVISVESAWKDMDILAYWKEMGESVTDADAIRYQVKLNNKVSLYSDITFRNRQLAAGEIEYRTEGSTVYEFVTLLSKRAVLQKPIYPMQLVGTAFEGTVREVQGENMKIHLRIDDDYPGEDCYWFPFSTPSASSDGSGWYCMPEIGDHVRVYFPSKKTGDAIAISAVSESQPAEDKPRKINMDEPAVMRNQGMRDMAASIMPVVKRDVSSEMKFKNLHMNESAAIVRNQSMRDMAVNIMPAAKKLEAVDMPDRKAVTKAVAYGQTGQVMTAARIFGKGV